MHRRIILTIHGNVQGVGYRYGIKKFCEKNIIFGRASNESDGTVKIVAEGDEANLHQLVQFCYNGIRAARVEYIDIGWEKAQNIYTKFEIR